MNVQFYASLPILCFITDIMLPSPSMCILWNSSIVMDDSTPGLFALSMNICARRKSRTKMYLFLFRIGLFSGFAKSSIVLMASRAASLRPKAFHRRVQVSCLNDVDHRRILSIAALTSSALNATSSELCKSKNE